MTTQESKIYDDAEKYKILNKCSELELAIKEKKDQIKNFEIKYEECQKQIKTEYEKSYMLKELEKTKKNRLTALRASIANKQTTLDALNQLYAQKMDKNKKTLNTLYEALNKLKISHQESVKLFDRLPVAQKLHKNQIEAQKLKIQVVIIKNKQEELKRQAKLRNEINKKINQIEIIKLAKSYVKYQNRLRENEKIAQRQKEKVNLQPEFEFHNSQTNFETRAEVSKMDKNFELPMINLDDSFDLSLMSDVGLKKGFYKRTNTDNSYSLNNIYKKLKTFIGINEKSQKIENFDKPRSNIIDSKEQKSNKKEKNQVKFLLENEQIVAAKYQVEDNISKDNEKIGKIPRILNETPTGCTQILAEMDMNDEKDRDCVENEITFRENVVKNIETPVKDIFVPPMPIQNKVKSPYFDATIIIDENEQEKNDNKNDMEMKNNKINDDIVPENMPDNFTNMISTDTDALGSYSANMDETPDSYQYYETSYNSDMIRDLSPNSDQIYQLVLSPKIDVPEYQPNPPNMTENLNKDVAPPRFNLFGPPTQPQKTESGFSGIQFSFGSAGQAKSSSCFSLFQ